MKLTEGAKRAIFIGTLCSVSYLAVYFARNILSAVSPQMIENGVYSTEQIGEISSVYFIFYAVGQLINGAIGDRIKARYMISFGLLLAGVSNFVFSLLSATPDIATAVYGLTGFFLAMIYGPMTKVVAENTEPIYTTRCSLGYTFASFFGSPLAGVVAAALVWQSVFAVSSISLIVMAIVCFAVFLLFEKKGFIKYGQYQIKKEAGKGNVKENITLLIQREIIKFSLISVLTGIVRTTVVFWLPTYLSQYLGFSSQTSASVFTVATFIISLNSFIAVFIYERLGHNMDKTVLLGFSLSAVFFFVTYLIKVPVLNVAFMVLAVMGSNMAASMLFSKYCPSLRDTGMVSSATGFLDFLSYMAASASSTIFANAVSGIGWGNLILVWVGLMLVGVTIALPWKKLLNKRLQAETVAEIAATEEAKEEKQEQKEFEE